MKKGDTLVIDGKAVGTITQCRCNECFSLKFQPFYKLKFDPVCTNKDCSSLVSIAIVSPEEPKIEWK